MNSFTYCVIRYTPDAGAGELLNVGVVVQGYAPGDLFWQFEKSYERLSSAFAGFSGKTYRAGIGFLEETLAVLRDTSGHALFATDTPARRASALFMLSRALVDSSLGFAVSSERGGITGDLASETARLFDRMVASRRTGRPDPQHRSNEEVWKGVYEPRISPDVRERLVNKTFSTPSVEVRFDHAFKNGAWHCVQPLSLDYKTADTISKHASEWAGKSLGLSGVTEPVKLYFLVGEPRQQRLIPTYQKALRLLEQAPVEHRIVEERDAAAFAEELADIVRHTPSDAV